MDSSILTHWVNQDAPQNLMLLLFRPGSHRTKLSFSSLGCMNRLPIHGTQGPRSRLATQDTAGVWPQRGSSHVLSVTATWREEVHVPELIQTSWTQQARDCLKSELMPKLCPQIGNSTRLQSWCLRICQYYAQSCCVTWDRPEYLCTSPWQSQRQTGMLPWVQSQHSPTSASCSSARLFCASLRVSKHRLCQRAHDREAEISSKTVVKELFNYNPSLIFASVNLHNG